jgi:ABC-type branched-subunit amino acid transport system ATPase component
LGESGKVFFSGGEVAVILDIGNVVFDGSAKEVLENEDLCHEYLAI